MLEWPPLFELSVLLLLSWGALAFGAEYAWAYTPLLVFCLVPGLLGLRAARGALPARLLLVMLAAVFLAGVAQLLLPAYVVPAGIQAGTPDFDFGRRYAQVTMHAPPEGGMPRISIAPARTLLSLAFLAAFA